MKSKKGPEIRAFFVLELRYGLIQQPGQELVATR